jgi:hypothetical protein
MSVNKFRLRARRRLSWNEPRELEQHDWDFCDCPPSELWSCFRYEYCRESKMREVVHWFRQNQNYCQSVFDAAKKIIERKQSGREPFTPDEKAVQEALDVLSWLNDECFGCVSDFPDIPWLDLDKKLRADYQKGVRESADHDAAIGGVSMALDENEQNVGWQNWKSQRERQHPGSICGWFSIHPGFNRKRIAKQFDRYLARIWHNVFNQYQRHRFQRNAGFLWLSLWCTS